MGVVPLAVTCAGCTGAAAAVGTGNDIEGALLATAPEPGDHGPVLGGTGAASGAAADSCTGRAPCTACVAEVMEGPACTKRALGTEAVRS